MSQFRVCPLRQIKLIEVKAANNCLENLRTCSWLKSSCNLLVSRHSHCCIASFSSDPFLKLHFVILCSSDVKNAEGKTALDLATDPDLLRAIRKHLDLESPEKCPLAENASTIEPESASDVASCAAEVTKVDETLDIMFTDQENAELETVKRVEEVEKCERSQGEAEEINSADEKSPEAVIEEGVSEGEDRTELKDKSQAQDPLAENFDEVEEVSALPVENMDVDSSEQGLERKSEEASSNATPVSPDSNKENLGSSSEGGSVSQEKAEEDKDRSPIMALGGLRKPKNPFTELRRSTSSSRAAMLVGLNNQHHARVDLLYAGVPRNRQTT